MSESRPTSTASTNSIPSINEGEFDVGDAKVQMSGLLMKKPFGGKKGKWQRRFCIVKEGFMLYYGDSESKLFEKNHHFNIHPKGVIPLAGCKVMETSEGGSQKFGIILSHDHFKGELVVGAENEDERKQWMKAFQHAGKVTWRNAQLGEKIIEQLEQKSLQVACEKQEAIDKLNLEASKLKEEKGQKEELQKLAQQLEEQKKAIEDAAKNLREEKTSADQELHETLAAMKQIEEEKMKIQETAKTLESNLKNLSKEKDLTAAQLAEREELARKLEQEKKTLEEQTSHLKGDLMSLEEHSKLLEKENLSAAERLKLEEEIALKLKEEVQKIATTADTLKSDLEEVEQAKKLTESKLEIERKKRIRTEKRLRLAEDSLKRLDRALKESGVQIDLQIETDVKNLKQFFEDQIAEEQFEAQKLSIMKEALSAKKTYTETTRQLSPPPEEQHSSFRLEEQAPPPPGKEQRSSPPQEEQPSSPPQEEKPSSPPQEEQPSSPSQEELPSSPSREQPSSPPQEEQPSFAQASTTVPEVASESTDTLKEEVSVIGEEGKEPPVNEVEANASSVVANGVPSAAQTDDQTHTKNTPNGLSELSS